MDNLGGAYYDLDLKDVGFKEKVDKASSGMKGLAGSFKDAQNASDILLKSIAGLAVGLVAYGVQAVSAYKESEVAEKQLAHAVIDVTHAKKSELKATSDLADQLEANGVLDGDAIKMGLAQLSTFGLSNKAVRKLGGSLADLAVNQFGVNASGEQLSETANMIAKALNGQFGVLEKSGIRFTKAQIHAIKFGKEMEKVKAINEGFAQNLKYTNAVALNTSEGLMAKLGVAFGNISEQVGKAIMDGIKPFLQNLGELTDVILEDGTVFDHLNNLFQDNKEAVIVVSGAIMGALVPALVALAASVWSTVAPIIPFVAAGAALGYLIYQLLQNFGGLTNILNLLAPAFQYISQLVQQTLVPALQYVWDNIVNELLPALQNLWNTISPVLLPVLEFLAKVIGVILYAALVAIIYIIGGCIKVLADLINWIISAGKWMVDFVGKSIQGWKLIGAIVSQYIKVQIDNIKLLIEWFKNIPKNITLALSNIGNAILKPFKDAFSNLQGMLNDIKKRINDALNPFVRHSPSLVDWVHKGANEMVSTYEGMFSDLAQISASNKVGLTSAIKVATGQQVAGNSTSNTTVNNVTINPQGIFARTPGDIRNIAEQIADAVKQANNARGPRVNIIG